VLVTLSPTYLSISYKCKDKAMLSLINVKSISTCGIFVDLTINLSIT